MMDITKSTPIEVAAHFNISLEEAQIRMVMRYAKTTFGVKEGASLVENETAAKYMPRICIALGVDAPWWKLWLFKQRHPKVLTSFAKTEFYDWGRDTWTIDGVVIGHKTLEQIRKDAQ